MQETEVITEKEAINGAAYSQVSTNFMEDRPIQAKGAYSYAEE
jgi:hypothetical protein